MTLVITIPRVALLHALIPPKPAADTSKLIVTPMPGLVVPIEVVAGQKVKSGEAVAVAVAVV